MNKIEGNIENMEENDLIENSKYDEKKYSEKDYLNNFYNKDFIEQKELSPKLNLSRYKTSKLFGITFYHIGNTYAFGFINNSSEPLFCIDKSWYFHLIILIIVIILAFTGNHYLFSSLSAWKQITYNILLFLFFIIYGALILLNPGIVITSQKGYKHTGYCRRCNIFFLPEENVYHCYDCNICVKKLDHHCSVVRKCITNKNFILFILMIINFVLLYVFSLVNLIYFLVDYFNNRKKKINKKL